MVVLCCIVVVTGFLPFPVSRSSLSSPPSQVPVHWMSRLLTPFIFIFDICTTCTHTHTHVNKCFLYVYAHSWSSCCIDYLSACFRSTGVRLGATNYPENEGGSGDGWRKKRWKEVCN